MNEQREAAIKSYAGYKQAIRDFLEGGVDELFSCVRNDSLLTTNFGISGQAKEILRKAIRQQQSDAEAYRDLVKLARDAGVPLFSMVTGDRRNGVRAKFNAGVDTNIDLRPQPALERRKKLT